ncbi:adenylate/guanylate cyclase domain-containing protein [Jatrophihabitans endophyticus]|uniref:adenylate/guanylate cyclase domain-containing protein n=1 Tax=Jatrophihabitans endophyticus TaxID=1206085 RepID=UPI0019E44724|nr:adenylate/guanylate cyclase domain-containing protein [Jatrophihabitans endophyticus]MBE7187909.1 adenylate/guanylate cyclase domain-containing protein [Jatrophihabitans endophyticus]
MPPLDATREVLRGETDRASIASNVGVARRLIVVTVVGANVVGAAIVLVLLGLVLPAPRGVSSGGGLGGVTRLTAALAGLYVLAALLAGTLIGVRLARPVIEFFASTREPDERDRRAVLRLPLQLFWLQCVLWGIAVVFFGVITLPTSGLLALQVATTTALAGVTTASFAYLLAQRLLRAGVAVVLADAPPRRREVPGVRPRALLAWALGIVPVGGAIVLAGFAPSTGIGLSAFARATIVLCGVGVAVGAAAMLAFARTVAGPLQRLRDAFARVEAGHFDVEVPVFDATEVGYAAASFNRMAAGLRERERLRDLFGRQVGADVARQALEQGVTLGGEERTAAALFVDVIGSTSFAADRQPTEVVDALNAFFEAVVGATQEHGGLVNKFIGDAALCVFGAPLAQDDPTGAALAAARDMRERLAGVELDAGIGVAFGTVVAGNVGTAERYEYTVIGDPVNEAARITELAKQRDGRVLASAAALEHADDDEAARWHVVDETTLRGRSHPTRLAEPVH